MKRTARGIPRPKRTRLGPRFDAALRLALRVHRDDTRKGKPTPYVSHLLGVCSLVLQHGGSEDEAIAALLHDTLEDHPGTVTPALLHRRFGPAVLAIVQACTDTPTGFKGGEKPPWRERKTAYVAHLANASRSAQSVSLADKLYNLRDLNADLRAEGRATLARFNAGAADLVWYFTAILKALRVAGYDGPMLAPFAETGGEFRKRVK